MNKNISLAHQETIMHLVVDGANVAMKFVQNPEGNTLEKAKRTLLSSVGQTHLPEYHTDLENRISIQP